MPQSWFRAVAQRPRCGGEACCGTDEEARVGTLSPVPAFLSPSFAVTDLQEIHLTRGQLRTDLAGGVSGMHRYFRRQLLKRTPEPVPCSLARGHCWNVAGSPMPPSKRFSDKNGNTCPEVRWTATGALRYMEVDFY